MVKEELKEQERELTSSEIVEKINDFYHNGTVIISSNFGCCKINIADTDNLIAEESGSNISMHDDADLEIIIDKSSICKSTLLDFEFDDKEIVIDLRDSNISFLLCN